ncbi:MAG: DUF881 domain-containing protein [Chitinophagales bacterium]
MKIKSAQISMALVCLILGIMLAVQFRTNEVSPRELSGDRWTGLTVQLANLQKERSALADEVVSLHQKLEQAASGKGGASQAINDELERANMAAGLIPVKGPGLVITLNDSTKPLGLGEDPNDYIIHDTDLLKVVNELRAAEAEAISINGQRVNGNSEIVCAGPNILLNVEKIVPPFVIKAIGDPDELESSLRIKGGWLESMQWYGIQVQTQKMDNIEIPAYKGSINFKYASPGTS